MTEDRTVVCVWRSGQRVADSKAYRLEHVVKLRNAATLWVEAPHRFVCLTDCVEEVEAAGVEALQLPTDWPGWWSKINLFAPHALSGSILYLDLDSLVTGPLDDLFRQSPGITMTADFYYPTTMNSTAMAWIGDYSAIWHTFAADAEALAARYDRRRASLVGDQGFIHDTLRNIGQHIDTFSPAHVVSFKQKATEFLPDDARVVAFHGNPKPDDPAAGWAFDSWTDG